MNQTKSIEASFVTATDARQGPLALRLGAFVIGSVMSAGCIGVSQPKADSSAPSSAALASCPGGFVPAADGNIDDFEDGNNQTNTEGGRDGYWYTAKDSQGSTFEIPAEGFATAEGGADGSTSAVHIKGTTVSGGDQAWGIELGMNFLNSQGEQYDASKYKAFSFKGKLGAKEAEKKVRVSLADVNTHPSGGVCSGCFNHFHATVELGPDWKEYTLAFEDLTQRAGWGAPRPANVTAEKLINVNYQIGGGKPFDMWIDDLKFLECKK
jgi:hypothetical protein